LASEDAKIGTITKKKKNIFKCQNYYYYYKLCVFCVSIEYKVLTGRFSGIYTEKTTDLSQVTDKVCQ